MTEPQAAGAQVQPQLVLQKLYAKNISLEVPGAPDIYRDPALNEPNGQQVQLNMQQTVRQMDATLFDVALSLTLTCKSTGDKTVYVAEVEQCGVFTLANFSQEQLNAILNTYCPNLLLPYARQVLSELTMNAGFPPFVVQPINFDQIYAEQLARRANGGVELPPGNA
jgi:preprotein translocase subunit SecB